MYEYVLKKQKNPSHRTSFQVIVHTKTRDKLKKRVLNKPVMHSITKNFIRKKFISYQIEWKKEKTWGTQWRQKIQCKYLIKQRTVGNQISNPRQFNHFSSVTASTNYISIKEETATIFLNRNLTNNNLSLYFFSVV